MSGHPSARSPAPASADVANAVASYLEVMDTVPGWFHRLDARIFTIIDSLQEGKGIAGNLLEIGVYRGKSAILLGLFLRPHERLWVCDIFDNASGVSDENVAESQKLYGGPARQEFEKQYLAFHANLPEVLAVPSTEIDAVLPSKAFRLVHVDGSHTYSVVSRDIATARHLLGPGGVVVFDDWMQPHAPGVSLAVWEEYLRGELRPLCATNWKMYATWDPSGLTAADLDAWAGEERESMTSSLHRLSGREIRVFSPAPASGTTQTQPRPTSSPRPPVTAARWRTPAVRTSAGRRMVRQVVPPFALAAYRKSRRWLMSGRAMRGLRWLRRG